VPQIVPREVNLRGWAAPHWRATSFARRATTFARRDGILLRGRSRVGDRLDPNREAENRIVESHQRVLQRMRWGAFNAVICRRSHDGLPAH
jgi:hypothetical protein